MQCDKCGSDCWDNTTNKRNPKGPDYKCKSLDCGHAIWLPKGTKPPSPPAKTRDTISHKAMIMAYAKDLVVALINANKYEGLDPANETVRIYDILILKLEA